MRFRSVALRLMATAWAALASAGPALGAPPLADLLFSSTRDGNAEVYLLRAGQGEWINLTRHEGGDNWPVWSPDGSRIAFQSNRTGNLDIWTMRADGTELVRLTDDPEPDYLPSWSRDGRQIVFTSWRREKGDSARAPHLYVMRPDGSRQRRLVGRTINTSGGADTSPDGRRIVFTRQEGPGADLYLADARTGRETRLTHDQESGVYLGSPTFSPDGRSIAFYAASDSASAIVVMDLATSARRTLIAAGQNWYPRWSRDGRWLTYTAAVPGGEKGDIDVFAIPVHGHGGAIRLVSSPRREQEGSWRPR